MIKSGNLGTYSIGMLIWDAKKHCDLITVKKQEYRPGMMNCWLREFTVTLE